MEDHLERVAPNTKIPSAEEIFREALDEVDEIFIVTRSRRDEQGVIVDFEYRYLNAAGLRMMGRPASQVVGHGLVELFPSHVPTGLFDAYRDVVVSGTPGHVVIPLFDENGVVGSFLVDVRKFGDGYVMIGREISEQLRHEGELRESRERFQLLAENTSDVVYRTDEHGRFTWVSPSVGRTLGWSVTELLDTSSSDLVHPDDLADLTDDKPTDGGPALRHESTARFLTRDGEYRWMHAISTRLTSEDGASAGSVVGLHDVHEQTVGKLALADSAALFRTAVHSAAIGMAIIDGDGLLIEVNTALLELLGFTGGSPDGMPVENFILDPDRTRVRAALKAEDDAVVLTDLRLIRHGGDTVWTRCAVVALRPADGSPVRHLVQVEDLTAQRKAQKELEYRAFHDTLTGLRNRAWILDILPEEFSAAKKGGRRLGMMLVDLDEFKVVNESLGHTFGDELLIKVAQRLQDALPSDYYLGRIDGDEFVVIAPEISSPAELEGVALSIMESLRAEVVLDGHHVIPSASVGISVSSVQSTAESMLRDADSALHRAKAGGRGRWQFSDEDMHRAAVEKISLVEDIRVGIERRQFVVHYMPIVEIAENRICGHEALVRWNHPDRGLLAPAAFLPVAEETGLINGIGDLVLEQVCRTLVDGEDLPGAISVNYSAAQMSQPGWSADVRSTLERFGVAPERIVIEVTETAVWNLVHSKRADLNSLRELGVGLHLDDFGTGYSPLSLLRDLPASGIKLDLSFVQGLGEGGTQTAAIAAGLADLVRALAITGIAEGIETAEQAKGVQDAGWLFGQGFLYGRPVPHPVTTLG